MAARALQVVALLALLLAAGGSTDRPATQSAALDATLRRWCSKYPQRDQLQVLTVDLHFPPDVDRFAYGDGVAITPVAIALPTAQLLRELDSDPAPLRTLANEGITSLAWEYPGRVRRDLSYRAMALLERSPPQPARLPANPTFQQLPEDQRLAARATAKDLEDNLKECADFAAWAQRSAGEGSHTARIVNLVRAVGERPEKPGRTSVCAALRSGRFSAIDAHYAVVMAARELGIPAYALLSAAEEHNRLVATYVDDVGWVELNIDAPDDGWVRGGVPLLTMAPVIDAINEGTWWSAAGAAYRKSELGGLQPFARSRWSGDRTSEEKIPNTTTAQARSLAEACR